MTMSEVRRHLGGVTRQTIYNWCKAGRLHKVDVPGVFLVSTESVLRLVNGEDATDSAVTPAVTLDDNSCPQASNTPQTLDTN